jgi:hypothetical protein
MLWEMVEQDAEELRVPRHSVPTGIAVLFVIVGGVILGLFLLAGYYLGAALWPEGKDLTAWAGPQYPRTNPYGLTGRVTQSLGSEHCDWQSVQVLTVPVETLPDASYDGSSANFVRDTKGALEPQATALRGELDLDAELPGDATKSPYTRGKTELWFSPSEGNKYAYIAKATGWSVGRGSMAGATEACSRNSRTWLVVRIGRWPEVDFPGSCRPWWFSS